MKEIEKEFQTSSLLNDEKVATLESNIRKLEEKLAENELIYKTCLSNSNNSLKLFNQTSNDYEFKIESLEKHISELKQKRVEIEEYYQISLKEVIQAKEHVLEEKKVTCNLIIIKKKI